MAFGRSGVGLLVLISKLQVFQAIDYRLTTNETRQFLNCVQAAPARQIQPIPVAMYVVFSYENFLLRATWSRLLLLIFSAGKIYGIKAGKSLNLTHGVCVCVYCKAKRSHYSIALTHYCSPCTVWKKKMRYFSRTGYGKHCTSSSTPLGTIKALTQRVISGTFNLCEPLGERAVRTLISRDGNTPEELQSKTPRLAIGDSKITFFCNGYGRIEGLYKDLTFQPQYRASGFWQMDSDRR